MSTRAESTCTLGLMSGTSMDSIDAVAVEFHNNGSATLLATHRLPLPPALKQQLLQLCEQMQQPLLGELDVAIGEYFAACALALLKQHPALATRIAAIGSHGQTVYHRPPDSNRPGFTQQIGDPNIIALRTGLVTVADFRRMDMAAGGQGAPLVPAFHREVFHSTGNHRAIVNIGGMANVTLLPGQGDNIRGFDTGPGNVLLDAWINRHRGKAYDNDGQWAAGGQVDTALLQRMLADPFFSKAPPKSTGREYFNLSWLHARLPGDSCERSPADIQATLTALTAHSIAEAIQRTAPETGEVFVCGGGAHNRYLMQQLSAAGGWAVADTGMLGIHPDWVEAAAFAWLARQRLENKPGNIPAVTGASRPVVLGGVYWP